MRVSKLVTFGGLIPLLASAVFAQPQTAGDNSVPIYRVTVVSRTTKAVNYHHRTGSTHIDFRGTELMPAARGEAKVDSQMGATKVDVSLDHLMAANQFGPEYMTFVLWAVTPEGRPQNLGEIVLEGSRAHVNTATDLQTFGLIVTAEPYYGVTQPSDVVVAENFLRDDTQGTIEQVDAKYELMKRGQYVLDRGHYQAVKINPKGPLQLAEAENAVEIARLIGADKYAHDTFQKALLDLRNAEAFLNGSRNRKESETDSREAIQMAEDARLITEQKLQDESLAAERAANAQREADARAQAEKARMQATQATADAEAARRQREQAQADKAAAERARLQAEQMTAQARQTADQAARDKAAAEAARQDALAQQQASKAEADRMRLMAQQSEAEKNALRERLRQQFAAILETRETARGLIVNINDVLFDFDKYTLKPGAREKLAKVSGILLAYPGLKVQLEGHTDAIGADDYNQTLSENRAFAVRDYLSSQGVPRDTLSAVGLGKADPVATNDTAEGRQQNRRVEMVVSGEPIGIGSLKPPQQ